MASVHSKQENDFIHELMLKTNVTLTWLGAVFYNEEFTWLDNSYVDFLNWSPGQPDHHAWGDCIGLGHLWSDGAWDDVDCRDYPGTSCVCIKSQI